MGDPVVFRTVKLRVLDEIVVKTVSNITVSIENSNLTPSTLLFRWHEGIVNDNTSTNVAYIVLINRFLLFATKLLSLLGLLKEVYLLFNILNSAFLILNSRITHFRQK
jgi:hypothetical protein